ncbi:hypothetical protein [Salinimicrobium sp. TH3]|uniref:hypothetical protein n=1 Tax=Salinimicrobium sp. TH3 TaxID=2997342 RepID=UPI0022723BBA|nr:hypothetical protein [Salinimicrobium sp. TH3]MCY2686178.1 hypothetical protein [Salinimicrobium sp. TH3]
MNLKKNATDAGEKVVKLWAAKKGLQWTGSLLKWGAIAGAGYFAYTLVRDNKDEIKAKLS